MHQSSKNTSCFSRAKCVIFFILGLIIRTRNDTHSSSWYQCRPTVSSSSPPWTGTWYEGLSNRIGPRLFFPGPHRSLGRGNQALIGLLLTCCTSWQPGGKCFGQINLFSPPPTTFFVCVFFTDLGLSTEILMWEGRNRFAQSVKSLKIKTLKWNVYLWICGGQTQQKCMQLTSRSLIVKDYLEFDHWQNFREYWEFWL